MKNDHVEALRMHCKSGHSLTTLTHSMLTELLAHIERLESNQVPEGFVAVPREPTIDMVEAGAVHVVKGMDYERAKKAWRAMIDAATHGEGE